MIDFSGINIGFNAGDLLQGTTAFYALFIGFVVLVLAVKFAPAIADFLFGIFQTAKGAKTYEAAYGRKHTAKSFASDTLMFAREAKELRKRR